MQAGEWEIDGEPDAHARRLTRRRNEAFRRRMQERKKRERQEAMRLYMASGAAVLSWCFVGMQLLR